MIRARTTVLLTKAETTSSSSKAIFPRRPSLNDSQPRRCKNAAVVKPKRSFSSSEVFVQYRAGGSKNKLGHYMRE